MSMPESSLPEAWVERIFATMRATYGASFDRQWECPPGVDPAEHGAQLKAHWARELRGYQQSPQAIRHALENLPDHPPNLVEFRALLRRAPLPEFKALPSPVSKPDQAMLAKAVGSLTHGAAYDPKAWARALAEREANGANLTLAQRTIWRTALKVPGSMSAREFLQPREVAA